MLSNVALPELKKKILGILEEFFFQEIPHVILDTEIAFLTTKSLSMSI